MISVKFAMGAAQIAGLGITALGAYVAGRAVIISEVDAEKLSGTYYNGNNALKASLLKQSSSAKWGLWLMAGGTVLQLISTALSLL